MSERQKLGTCKLAKLALSHSLTLDMLNNFCFHVYAQKSLSHSHTLSLFHSLTLSLSHSLTLNMLNNFCFHVYAQKSLSHSHTLSISHSLSLDMLNNFCFHVHAQKSLFIGENANAFFWPPPPHPILWVLSSLSWFPAKNEAIILCAKCWILILDPWDIPSNVCFHV